MLSECVQMPSLPSVQIVQDTTGLPVVTAAASATTREIMQAIGIDPMIPNAGAALAGDTPSK